MRAVARDDFKHHIILRQADQARADFAAAETHLEVLSRNPGDSTLFCDELNSALPGT